MGREYVDGQELGICLAIFELLEYRIVMQPEIVLVVVEQGLSHLVYYRPRRRDCRKLRKDVQEEEERGRVVCR